MTDIDYSRLRSLTARLLRRALIRDGFYLDRQSGSHRQYYHDDGRRVTLSFHRLNDTYSPKILRTMIGGQARWSDEDLTRLGLLRRVR